MASRVEVRIAGDASGLQQAATQAQQALGGVAAAATTASRSTGRALASTGGQALAREAREATRALDQTGNAAERALTKISTMGHGGAALLVFDQIKDRVVATVAALWQAGEQAQRTRTLLDFASAGRGAQALADVRALSDRLGLSLTETAASYGKFAAAARGTSLEGQQAKQVFTAVSEAAAVMGLSAADTSGVLLALQQMVSKGTVSAEELRGQLGERLPGAFQIAARAMGVTTAELGKMLEQGQIMADDFLPRFAEQLRQELGDAAEEAGSRFEAATNRMASAWDQFKATLANSGLMAAAASALNSLTYEIKAAGDAMEIAKAKGAGFWGQMAALAGQQLGRLVGTEGSQTLEVQIAAKADLVGNLQAEADRLASHGVRIPYRDAELGRAKADLAGLTRLQQIIGGDDGMAASDRKLGWRGEAAAATDNALANARKAVADATQKAVGVNADYLKGLAAISALQAADPGYDPTADATALANKYGKAQLDAAKSSAAEAAQAARAQAEVTLAVERVASDARLRGLAQQMADVARLRETDVLTGQQWAEAQVALLRQVEAEQLAQNQRAQQAVQAQPAQGAAEAARQRAELARLRGEAQRLTADAIAAETKAVEDGYADAARDFGAAADSLRQAVDQARGQILQTSDANAQLAIARIADPVARAAALAAWQVRRSREETEREIAALEARIAAFRAAGGDNALDIGNAQAAIAGLRSGQQQTEAAIQLRLADETQPEFTRLLTDWADTTRQMRQTWDSAITQMTDGAADAFGRFVSGQQVSLQQLAQQMLYTLGRGLFQQLAGQAANGLGLTAPAQPGGQDGGLGAGASDEASQALSGSAAALSGAAQDSSGALGSAAAQLVQSALGWLLPQAAQTAAGTTLTGAAIALTGAASALSLAAASMTAGSATQGIVGAAAMFARRGATYGAVPFANGGAFARGGEILTGPVAFRFRDGARLRRGVAGEAGPEAALPLRRGQGGQLGVMVHGGGRGVLPLSRGSGGVLGVDLAAVRALALGRQPRSAREARSLATGQALVPFAAGGVFGAGAADGAAPGQALRDAQAPMAAPAAALARPNLALDLRAEIHVDARTDQAEVARAVGAALTAQEKRLWKTLRERGIAA